MIVPELEKAIEQAKADGLKPFYVTATAATTVLGESINPMALTLSLGAYDDFPAIADIAEKHGDLECILG